MRAEGVDARGCASGDYLQFKYMMALMVLPPSDAMSPRGAHRRDMYVHVPKRPLSSSTSRQCGLMFSLHHFNLFVSFYGRGNWAEKTYRLFLPGAVMVL